jgi:hypothetical protein
MYHYNRDKNGHHYIIQGAEEKLNAYAATSDAKRYCASAVASQGNST